MPASKTDPRKTKTNAKVARKRAQTQAPQECTIPDDIDGISVSSPDGEWLGELHVRRYDTAQNHGRAEQAFFIGMNAVFVADEVLAMGVQKVTQRLCQEAVSIWCWHFQDGKPLVGRVPTGFECKLNEAASVMCGLYANKPQPSIS